MNAIVKEKALTYSKKSYFITNAESISLGAIGTKKTPIGKASYVDVYAKAPAKAMVNIEVGHIGPVHLKWEIINANRFGASLKVLKQGGATGKFSHEAAEQGDLVAVKLRLDRKDLIAMINERFEGALSAFSNKVATHIIGEVWVAMEATLAKVIAESAELAVSGAMKGTDVELKAELASNKSMRIKLPKGTIIAYLPFKVKSWAKGNAAVIDLEDDQQGLG